MAESVARGRINWGVLGVEAAAIFASVLLGFAVTEWREARAESERRDALLAAFAVEVAENRDRLVERGTYHHWLGRQIGEGMRAGEIQALPDIFQIENVSGFNPLAIDQAAWATATATGDIALLDFETAQVLWRLYTAQQEIDAEQLRLRARALDALGSSAPSPIGPFALALREFLGLERELLYLLNTAGAEIAEARGAAPPDAVDEEVFARDPFAEPVAPADPSP